MFQKDDIVIYVPNYTYTGTTIISSNTTWATPAWIKGTVIVPNGLRLSISSEIQFSLESKIIVQPGGTLALLPKSKLTSITGCKNLWAGIELQSSETAQATINHGSKHGRKCSKWDFCK